MDPRTAVSESQMAEALDSVGVHHRRVNVEMLPGLLDRSRGELDNFWYLEGTRVADIAEDFVRDDDVRKTL